MDIRSHWFVVNITIQVWKRSKINKKRRGWPIRKIRRYTYTLSVIGIGGVGPWRQESITFQFLSATWLKNWLNSLPTFGIYNWLMMWCTYFYVRAYLKNEINNFKNTKNEEARGIVPRRLLKTTVGNLIKPLRL